MSSPSADAVKAEVEAGKMKVSNWVVDSAGAPITNASPMYVDASGQMGATLPVPFATGAANTGIAFMTFRGSATGSADELMHLSLVKGANATAVIAGYARVTVTDDAGVITNGSYYAPFYTLG